MKKICVCMWYDDNIIEYAHLFKQHNQSYCDRNNYTLIHSDKLYTDKPQSYNKLFMIKELLEKGEYDYYVWIDADAHFVDEYILDYYIIENKDFVFSADITNNINCGVFIVKNSDYSKLFIDKWINSYESINENWWEQGVLGVLWNCNILQIKDHSYVYFYGGLQHFKYNSSQLVYHMAGTTAFERTNYIRNFLIN